MEENLSRSELLKVLAASGGGLLVVAFLPGKWLKPVVEAGVLPAHAQGTETLQLVDINVEIMQNNIAKPEANAKTHFQGTVWYKDMLCRAFIDPTYFFGYTEDGSLQDFMVHMTHPEQHCEGNYDFNFYSYCNTVFHTYMKVGDRQSNSLSEDLIHWCFE